MPVIAVINNTTGEMTAIIMAELNDECPEGHRFELISESDLEKKIWDGEKFVDKSGQKVIPLEI
jgi:hypothetical protein